MIKVPIEHKKQYIQNVLACLRQAKRPYWEAGCFLITHEVRDDLVDILEEYEAKIS